LVVTISTLIIYQINFVNVVVILSILIIYELYLKLL